MNISGNKKIITAWTFYDWANSVYPLVITTAIFPVFYENATSIKENGQLVNDVVTVFGRNYKNSEIYFYTISISFLLVSVLSPLLSGIADYSGNKKIFMQFFCYLGALSCASLYFFDVAYIEAGLASMLFASTGFWGSLVFYNAFLPEIAEPKDHDRISARGYAMGYLGSSLLLILCLLLILFHNVFGFETKETPTRLSFFITAAWWIGFAQIPFAVLPDNVFGRKPQGNIFTRGFSELLQVWKALRSDRRLKRYLSAFFVYSMGVQTVMLAAVLFAKKEVKGLEDGGLIMSVLLIQFIAIGGSFLFSFLSEKSGNKTGLSIALFIWCGVCLGSYSFLDTAVEFYVIAGIVGLVMGGIQSLSRSTYSKFLPSTQDHASYFSFYDVTEKIAIVIGTFSFGYIEGFTGSMRNSVLSLIVFFVVGFILLLTVPKKNIINYQ